jgi:hypothetical protein
VGDLLYDVIGNVGAMSGRATIAVASTPMLTEPKSRASAAASLPFRPARVDGVGEAVVQHHELLATRPFVDSLDGLPALPLAIRPRVVSTARLPLSR